MDVTKLPPAGEIAPIRPDVGAGHTPGLRQSAAPAVAGSVSTALADAVAALADPVHIHPLDLAGALQILTAEVRAELPLPGDAPHAAGRLEPLLLAAGGLPEEAPAATAPQTLAQAFLQPAPELLQPAVWLASVTQVEGALQAALDRGLAAVTAWRDVPAAVVDGTRETREVVLAAILDEPPNPLWLQPEWLGLAPRLEWYARRRRRARRALSDPDPHWRESDGDDQTQHGERPEQGERVEKRDDPESGGG